MRAANVPARATPGHRVITERQRRVVLAAFGAGLRCWPGGRSAAPPARAGCSVPRPARHPDRLGAAAPRGGWPGWRRGSPPARRSGSGAPTPRSCRAGTQAGRRGARLVHHRPAGPVGVLPGWKRAAVRWAAVAAAAGLVCPPADHRLRARLRWPSPPGARAGPRWRRCAVRAAGGPAGLPPAVPVPRHRPRRPARPVAGRPARLRRRARTRVVTLAYPAAWNPDAARQKHIDEVIRRHLGGDLAGSFGPYPATWRHPPAPPDLRPVRRVRPARPPHPPGHPGRRPQVDRGPGKRGTAPVHRGRHRRRQDRHRVGRRRARPRARLADRHHRPQTPLLHQTARPATTC